VASRWHASPGRTTSQQLEPVGKTQEQIGISYEPFLWEYRNYSAFLKATKAVLVLPCAGSSVADNLTSCSRLGDCDCLDFSIDGLPHEEPNRTNLSCVVASNASAASASAQVRTPRARLNRPGARAALACHERPEPRAATFSGQSRTPAYDHGQMPFQDFLGHRSLVQDQENVSRQ
jgi:hypothetical protein